METLWNQDYLDLLDCLREENVAFLVVGAFAVAIHGLPRATGDIDLFVRPAPDNAARLIRALARFGAPLDTASVTEADFARAGIVYQIGISPRRIDLLTEISGVSFEEAWSTRISRTVSGRELPFLGRDELLRNKRAAARPKDLADVDALERLK